jgi:hypothetical protein
MYMHFCDYLPLEENLVLHLDKFLIFSPKDDLYQIWLKLAFCFGKDFFQYKYGFPYCGPS